MIVGVHADVLWTEPPGMIPPTPITKVTISTDQNVVVATIQEDDGRIRLIFPDGDELAL